MRHVELHHDRGNKLTPCAAQEAFFLPLCCYFSQPTSKVRTPKARVVRALCLLSMCVITSFKSWRPSRELECLSADSFKEQRARDSRHMLDSYAHITAQKGCDSQVTALKSNCWATQSNQRVVQSTNSCFETNQTNQHFCIKQNSKTYRVVIHTIIMPCSSPCHVACNLTICNSITLNLCCHQQWRAKLGKEAHD